MERVLVGDVVSKLNLWSRGVGKAGKVLIRKPDADVIHFFGLDQHSDSP